MDKSHGPLLQEVGKRVRRQPPSFLFGVFRDKRKRKNLNFFNLKFFFFKEKKEATYGFASASRLFKYPQFVGADLLITLWFVLLQRNERYWYGNETDNLRFVCNSTASRIVMTHSNIFKPKITQELHWILLKIVSNQLQFSFQIDPPLPLNLFKSIPLNLIECVVKCLQ